MRDYGILLCTSGLVLAGAIESAPGFLSHFPPTIVQSLVEDDDLLSPEQHTLATPIPPAPSHGPASIAPYVERYAMPNDVQQVYKDAWNLAASQQKSASSFLGSRVPSAVDQMSMSPLYAYPVHSLPGIKAYSSDKHFHNVWSLPVIPAYYAGLPTLPQLPQYTGIPPAPYLAPPPTPQVSSESEPPQTQQQQPTNALYDALLPGPKMASHIGDSLGSQMGSSLGSTLASDLNLLQGLTNAAAQNFFSVFNGQFQRPQPNRLLAGVTNDILALPTVLPPVLTPSVPTATITARPVAEVWNEAVENLQEAAQNLSLPTLVGINTSLPVLDTIGAGSELPALSSHAGSNVGSVVGTTIGNTIASTADLWKALLQSAGTGFMSAISPSIAELASMFDRKPMASVSGRRLQQENSDTSCVETDTLYESPLSVTFNDVPNRKTCNLICQLYSTPAVITGEMENCYAADELPCLWISYSRNSHRCTLLFALANQFQVEGFVSEPVYCPGQSFLQTSSALTSLDAMGCNLTAIRSNVVTVVDNAKPPPPRVAKSLLEIPEFPEFTNPDADSQSIWKYNPDIPLNQRGDFEEDVIYQIGYGISNPLENKLWGQASGIKDWRGCVFLCHQDEECRYWTYHFDPLTYNSRYGACVLATNKEPKGQAVSRIKTISGRKMTSFPTDLFGSVFNDTTTTPEEAHLRRLYVADPTTRSWIPINKPPPRRLSESGSPLLPTVVSRELLQAYGLQDSKYMSTEEPPTSSQDATGSCREYGFAYYVPGITNSTRLPDSTYSTLASTVDDCDLVCRSTADCIAYQFVPKKLLTASTTLMSHQSSSCVLLKTLDTVAQISVPSVVSGIASPNGDAEACILNEKPRVPTVVSVALPTLDSADIEDGAPTFASASTPSSQSSLDGDTASALSVESTSCLDKNGEAHSFAAGVSIRGKLLSEAPNILRGLANARECHTACTDYQNCTAFTWGAWQGCYLLQSVEAFVTDSSTQVVSGYADCKENSARDLKAISGKARMLEAESSRTLSTCAKAYKGLVYIQGSIIGNRTDIASANECWSTCRETPDCYYMTYLSFPDAKDTNASQRHMCLWFDQVSATQSVQTQLSTSAESNCDVLGDLEFEGDWAMSRLMRTVNVPAVSTAAAGGLAVVAGGALLWKQKKKKSGEDDSSSTKPATELSDQNALNAFGMPEPSLEMSPGAVERGSPALQLDDFEKVEPNMEKSTSKRLRRYF